jgi:hypothetical protein
MKRFITLALGGLFALATSAWANGPLGCCVTGHCITPPCSTPECSCPCDGHHHCSCRKVESAHKLIAELSACTCCDRISAARKLGHRWNADFCCTPEVLDALVHALQCDPCWEVRRAAAWSIGMQGARNQTGVLALYVASKLDPHYMVRDKAAEALDIMLLCERPCFKELFKAADELVKALRGKYKPGTPECVAIFATCCAEAGIHLEERVPPPPPVPAVATIAEASPPALIAAPARRMPIR